MDTQDDLIKDCANNIMGNARQPAKTIYINLLGNIKQPIKQFTSTYLVTLNNL